MISDYLIVAWVLLVVSTLTKYWAVCSGATFLLWVIFAVRIGNVHYLGMEDMTGEEEQDGDRAA